MQCKVYSEKKGRRCRNAAAPGSELCEFHAGRRAAGIPVVLVGDPSPLPSPDSLHEGGAASAVPPPPGIEGEDLPPAPPIDAEPITAAGNPLPPSPPPGDLGDDDAPSPSLWGDPAELDRLDALAASFWGRAVKEVNPEDADDVAAARDPAVGVVGVAGMVGGRWDPPRVERYLKMLNGVLERTGKDPLTPGEIREGGVALAPVLDEWFGRVDPSNPYVVACLWILLTFGTRYAGDVARWVRGVIARRRGGSVSPSPSPGEVEASPSPSPSLSPAATAADRDGLPQGWAVIG